MQLNGHAKTFVVDTNVLLYNLNALFMFADNEVIIPFDVIEELDKFKAGTDATQIDNPYLDSSSNGLSYVVERLKGKTDRRPRDAREERALGTREPDHRGALIDAGRYTVGFVLRIRLDGTFRQVWAGFGTFRRFSDAPG